VEPAPQPLRSRCPRCCYEFMVDPHHAFFPNGGAQAAPRESLPQVDAQSWGMRMTEAHRCNANLLLIDSMAHTTQR
jgi:hypothetical protein